MAKPLRPKRGTTAKNDAFTGLASEITIDTDKHSIRVHDGVTAGGHEILPKAKNDELYAPKTIDVGVTSVNGNTGAVTVDVGVTSVNGKTGAVTGIVTSVNGASADASGNVAFEVGGFDVPKGNVVEVRLTIPSQREVTYKLPVDCICVMPGFYNCNRYVNGADLASIDVEIFRLPVGTVLKYVNTQGSTLSPTVRYFPI